ncbi:hypothetical protein [Arundinibacter roseus]|uniref:Uncharacterized protein n=1 Tax=Arundinibacter roseus TaxID=2070510 RepID=A0A4R4KHL1_9BACT|nr:hypothetical protein [Arundinibacter roseus]TDB67538.1 hypothetical protein EZE20_06230 [Arundinibacter roseus]
MRRTPNELVEYLFRETTFVLGVFLKSGTGILAPSEFTRVAGDQVRNNFDCLGTLTNTITQKPIYA